MRGRLLIIVGILLLLIGLLGFLFLSGGLGGNSNAAPTAPALGGVGGAGLQTPIALGPTPTPISFVNIVIAVQELPRGFRIPQNAVAIRPWPSDSAPFSGITDIEQVVNKIARTDIFREQPILSNMLVEDYTNLSSTLGRVGSDAAAILPSGLVAIAMPIDRFTGIAYGMQDGDRVDVIVSMLFVDVDEQFQSLVPNDLTLIDRNSEEGIQLLESIQGRPTTTTLGYDAILGPSERQRPRLLTQRTVQDALVVHVGEFPTDGRFLGIPPTPTPLPDETGAEGDTASTNGDEPPPPTPTPARPDIITLGVSPQDAVLLVWAIESRLPLTLALRSATDTSRIPTEPVTLDFFMSEYRITVPTKREYTVEPALTSIRQLPLDNVTDAPSSPSTEPSN